MFVLKKLVTIDNITEEIVIRRGLVNQFKFCGWSIDGMK